MISENSCIKIDYTAYIKDTKQVFDTTIEEKARSSGIYAKNVEYEPLSLIVGKGLVVQGLDESFIGKKEGDKYTVEIPAIKAFGIKNNKLLKLIPQSYFSKNKIQPMPGMQVYIDNVPGTVRTASPGRVIVDFNHPLSSKDVIYDVKVVKEVKDEAEIIQVIADYLFGRKAAKVSGKDKQTTLETKAEVPKTVQEAFKKAVRETLKKECSITFVVNH